LCSRLLTFYSSPFRLVTHFKTSHDYFVQDILHDHAENGTLFGFDGYEALAGYLGNYAQGDATVDLTHRIRTDNALSQQWTNILPFYRQSNGVYDNKVFMLPVRNILMNPLHFVIIPCICNLFISHIKSRPTTMDIFCFIEEIFSLDIT